MNATDRLLWLLLGCFIGFILGYLSRVLTEIKEELDHVDQQVSKKSPEERHASMSSQSAKKKRNKWIPTLDTLEHAALFVVVLITVLAAVASQQASNKVESTQEQLTSITVCNQEYLSETLDTLNTRSSFNEKESLANLRLQKAQARLVRDLIAPTDNYPLSRKEALERYDLALQAYSDLLAGDPRELKTLGYPTQRGLALCIQETLTDERQNEGAS